MGRSITIASGKGGVGKTTLVANVGIALAQLGKDVMVVDADLALASLGMALGIPTRPTTLQDVLVGDITIHEAIYEGPGGIKFVPSGLSYESFKRVSPEKLETILKDLSLQTEYLLIDAPAGLNPNVLSAISGGEEMLIVATPDAISVADALKIKMTGEALEKNVIGVVVNMVRNERNEISAAKIKEMLLSPVLTSIPEDSNVRIATRDQKPVVLSNPNSPAAIEYKRVAAMLAGVEFKAPEAKKESFIDMILKMLPFFGKR